MLRRLPIPLLATLTLALLLASPVAAHAQLVTSTPGAGEVVAEPPTELRLTFSEPIEAGYTSATVVDESGTKLVSAGGEPDPADQHVLVVPLPALADGAYTVTWRTLSAADGHTISGFIVFGVGSVELPAGATGGGVEPGSLHPGQQPLMAWADAIARFLGTGGLMLALGLGIVGWLVIRPVLGELPEWLVVGQLLSLLASAAGAILLLVVNAAGAAGSGIAGGSYALDSRTGQLILLRFGVAGLATILGGILLARREFVAGMAAVAGLAGIVLVGLAGHAAGYGAVGPVVALAVHVAAAATWVAGLLTLVILAFAPATRGRLRECVPRYSALALVSIGLAVISGAYFAWLATGQVFFLGTEYGLVLGLKIALVGAALALGAFHYFDGGRRLGTALRPRLIVEAVLAVAVVGVTANLASASPPAQAKPVSIAPAPGQVQVGEASISLLPGRVGVNGATVEFAEPQPVDATVELRLGRVDADIGQSVIPLTPVHEDEAGAAEGGHAAHSANDHAALGPTATYAATGLTLPADSRWTVAVVSADHSGTELVREQFDWSMGDSGIANGAAEPPLDPVLLIAVVLMAAGVLGLAYWLGGGVLPRCNEAVSRLALPAGGVVSALLGVAILLGSPG
jgi:copper transport protein